MRGLTQAEIDAFHEKGCVIAKRFFEGSSYLDDAQGEIETLGRVFDPSFNFAKARDTIEDFAADRRGRFYDALRYLTSLAQIASAPILQSTSRQVGMGLPAVMRSYNLRMDMPSEDKHLFHWHQDIAYLLGSLNSVTYWIPLGPVDRVHGSVEIIEGSHRHGMLPVRYTCDGQPPANKSMSPSDLVLVNEPTEDGLVVEADRGDLIIFSQFILHRSIPNRCDRIRWTAQIRHSDLSEPSFVAAGYPWGDATNIFHNNYLADALAK